MRRTARLLVTILGIQMVLGLGYAVSTPLWQGHEPDFYNVVRFVVDNGRLPVSEDFPQGDAEIRQATQPPLYFLIAGPIVALLDDHHQPVPPGRQPNILCLGGMDGNSTLLPYPSTAAYDWPTYGAVTAAYGLRVLNVLIGLTAVLFTYWAGRSLWPEQPTMGLVGAALLAFEANTNRLSGTINNDTLLLALSAANLLFCVRILDRARWQDMTLAFISAALALLTRIDGWAVLALDGLVVAVLLTRVLKSAGDHRQAWVALVLLGLLAAAGVTLAASNYSHYGNIFGRYSQLVAAIEVTLSRFGPSWPVLLGVLNQTALSYQTPLTELSNHAILREGYLGLVIVSLAGVVWSLFQVRRNARQRQGFLLLFTAVIIAVAMVVVRNALGANAENTTLYNTGFIFAPLRYYISGLPAMALIFSVGLMALVPRSIPASQWNPLGVVAAAIWLGVTGAGLVSNISRLPPNPVISRAALAAIPNLNRPDETGQPDGPQVLGYTVQEQQARVDLTLYLSAVAPMTLNYAGEAQLADANHVSRCQFMPTRGVYPTIRWKPGQVVVAKVSIPSCVGELTAPVHLSLRWLGASLDGTIVTELPPLDLASLSNGLQQAVSCPENLGRIDNSFQVLKFNTPSEVHGSETYLPSLNWLVLNPLPEAAVRVLFFTQAETGQVYVCRGSPSLTAQTPQRWLLGEQIYFDVCPMHFPADALPGVYTVTVGMVDSTGHLLPVTDADGVPGDRIEVGTVTLVYDAS